jgi:hypothetical protein
MIDTELKKEEVKVEAVNEDIIHLQNAHITQYSNMEGNSPWMVRKNITNEDLFQLPMELSEEEVFKIMAFARKFELIAFNEGVMFGKKKARELYEQQIANYNDNMKLAREENERLANKLLKLISKEEN